jgi:hypothetical protein
MSPVPLGRRCSWLKIRPPHPCMVIWTTLVCVTAQEWPLAQLGFWVSLGVIAFLAPGTSIKVRRPDKTQLRHDHVTHGAGKPTKVSLHGIKAGENAGGMDLPTGVLLSGGETPPLPIALVRPARGGLPAA